MRKSTADQFYVTLLTFDDLLAMDVSNVVMGLLSDTAWYNMHVHYTAWHVHVHVCTSRDGAMADVREKRNELCQVLQLPVPKLVVS